MDKTGRNINQSRHFDDRVTDRTVGGQDKIKELREELERKREQIQQEP